jgi:aspartyl/asparaginyl beta-hydroxylase (cupin superfamily)
MDQRPWISALGEDGQKEPGKAGAAPDLLGDKYHGHRLASRANRFFKRAQLMNMKLVRRGARTLIILAVLFYFIPWIAAFFVLCGIVDLSRHRRFDTALISKYLTGNGLLTWLLSPVNLVFDLISKRRPGVLRIEDFDPPAQAEIRELLAAFDTDKEAILADINASMGDSKRGMLFYKWYDQNLDTSRPLFNKDWTFIKTIGVSVFNSREKTGLHFGPLRLTVRLLYNLTARQSDNIFIEVNGQKHFWHDDPLFIFDDTIQHRSVNEEDGYRAVVFVDVLRPSRFPGLQNAIIKVFNAVLKPINRLFYKNWDMLGGGTPEHRT